MPPRPLLMALTVVLTIVGLRIQGRGVTALGKG